ncbi:hypothetical protein [Acinetobacter sp. YK3]|uniref:hypothetical protein n=1 Tax=Acinetobacter sp. YK3 TaxID=1860097 RepID=UPI00084C038E|nr:hypothetical protein [Acinetobacter sp. YK3]OEC92387.1 hypothetical protein A9Z07_15030 [Acinetobacter sp. YK3]
MTLKGVVISILAITLISVSYLYLDYRKTGGYQLNSDGYYGYSFPADNGLNKVEDCELANTEHPNEPPVSKEWMEGCKRYFEIKK